MSAYRSESQEHNYIDNNGDNTSTYGLLYDCFAQHFLSKLERLNGPNVPGIGPFNSTMLVVCNHIIIYVHDTGMLTANDNIFGFCNAKDDFNSIINGSYADKNGFNNVYTLPLIISVDDCESMWNWIIINSLNYVITEGENQYQYNTEAECIAYAYSSVLANICHELTTLMTEEMIDSESMKNINKVTKLSNYANRMMLRDAFDWIVITIRSIIDYSPAVKYIFETMRSSSDTTNTIQSENAKYVLTNLSNLSELSNLSNLSNSSNLSSIDSNNKDAIGFSDLIDTPYYRIGNPFYLDDPFDMPIE